MTRHISQFSESLEDYLEGIAMLGGHNVRSIDLANQLGVSKASVNYAINTLISNGMVVKAPYGDISLTTLGMETSERVLRKHLVIKKFLTDVLNVDSETANIEACGIEHNVSDQTLNKLEQFMNQLLKSS